MNYMMVCSRCCIIPAPRAHTYPQAIIKRLRWGLPAGAENAPHVWTRVAKFARQVITNTRGDWKKAVGILPTASFLTY